jgi:hypothetical protein
MSFRYMEASIRSFAHWCHASNPRSASPVIHQDFAAMPSRLT